MLIIMNVSVDQPIPFLTRLTSLCKQSDRSRSRTMIHRNSHFSQIGIVLKVVHLPIFVHGIEM